jgi:hypothetical protein
VAPSQPGHESRAGWPVVADRSAIIGHGDSLNVFKDVGIGFLLPFGQLIPVGDVGRFRVRESLVDLPDPAKSNEGYSGEFRVFFFGVSGRVMARLLRE